MSDTLVKKIFLYAYDRINLGDDLFVHTIANRYPNAKFYLWSNKNNIKTFSALKNLRVLPQDCGIANFLKNIRLSLFSKYKYYMEKKCDAVVYIGGSIFIEYENWKQILSWWDYEAKNRQFYILGANFGPYKTEAYKEKLADILENTSDICFRDKYSYNLFSNVSKVRYAPDILMSQKFCPDIKEKKQIFISVIDCKSRNEGFDKISDKEERYISLLSDYITLSVQNGYKVVLSSFCKIEKDEDAVIKIINSLSPETDKNLIQVINYDGTNIDNILLSIAQSEIVLASRFHAAILGFAANKPVFPIIYSNKTKNILEDFGFGGKYLDIRNLDESSKIDIKSSDYETQKLSNINMLKQESEKHFSKLDVLMGKNS